VGSRGKEVKVVDILTRKAFDLIWDFVGLPWPLVFRKAFVSVYKFFTAYD
jgi:hypothetical protein